MASLVTTARIQWVQWAAIAAWHQFEKNSFHQYALQGERPAKGTFLDDREPLWGHWALSTFIILAATAQLKKDASIRKVLQYFNVGYIGIIIYILANGYQESNLNALIWAALNAFFLVIVVYVWHKDAKNDQADTDSKLQNALRISYGSLIFGLIWEATGKSFELYLDQSINNEANLNAIRCASLLRLPTIGALIAAAQIDRTDQKKVLQYFMAVLLLAIPRIAYMQYQLSTTNTWGVILSISILIQVITHAVYGGSCEKQVIRLYYTSVLSVALIGFLNTSLFLKLTSPSVDSLDAGLIAVGKHAHFGILYVVVAQLDAKAHRKILQYSLLAHAFNAYILYNVGYLNGAIYLMSWAAIKFGAVYRNELGLASVWQSIAASAGASSKSSERERSASPKRGTSAGRSSTPSGKKKTKKK